MGPIVRAVTDAIEDPTGDQFWSVHLDDTNGRLSHAANRMCAGETSSPRAGFHDDFRMTMCEQYSRRLWQGRSDL